ncbi:MAG: hypothetical protein N2378_00700 [Chloroflexaceae bacterium]|nr:hypothetical protein [Chloroflexaceae bacterium]
MSRWPADIPDGAPVMLDASILVYAFIASRRVRTVWAPVNDALIVAGGCANTSRSLPR